jgi:hypothetical protein
MSIATISDEAPLDPDDELLVSYLDGELSREEQSSLQSRLLSDQTLRRRLQQLQSGWDLLEELPQPSPSLQLVESTLELAVADVVREQPRDADRWTRWRWPMIVALVCLLGTAGAYAVSAAAKSHQYDQQLQDLAIAENLDAYMRGKDLELMRQLSASADWSKMVAASREMGDLKAVAPSSIASTTLSQREAMVRQLPIEKLRQLNLRWDRFSGLGEVEQAQVRRTADAVSRQPDAELLLQTMQTYAVWIQNLPTELRDEIESTDPAIRRAAIDRAVELTQISISQRSTMKLDDETIDWIYFALQQVLRKRIEDRDELTINFMQRLRERIGEGQDEKYATIAMMVFSGSLRGPGAGGPGAGGPGAGGPGNSAPASRRRPFWFGAPPGGDRLLPLTPEELSTVRLVLPDRAVSVLDLIAVGDPWMEALTLRAWTEEAVRRHSPFNRRDDSTWLQRYNELPSSERDLIDLLPPKEILSELSRESPFP